VGRQAQCKMKELDLAGSEEMLLADIDKAVERRQLVSRGRPASRYFFHSTLSPTGLDNLAGLMISRERGAGRIGFMRIHEPRHHPIPRVFGVGRQDLDFFEGAAESGLQLQTLCVRRHAHCKRWLVRLDNRNGAPQASAAPGRFPAPADIFFRKACRAVGEPSDCAPFHAFARSNLVIRSRAAYA